MMIAQGISQRSGARKTAKRHQHPHTYFSESWAEPFCDQHHRHENEAAEIEIEKVLIDVGLRKSHPRQNAQPEYATAVEEECNEHQHEPHQTRSPYLRDPIGTSYRLRCVSSCFKSSNRSSQTKTIATTIKLSIPNFRALTGSL